MMHASTKSSVAMGKSEHGRNQTARWRSRAIWRTIPTVLLIIWLVGAGAVRPAHANAMRPAWNAYSRGDYIHAVALLSPLAMHGNPQAQALLGFMYENGFGVPQAYDVAADLYQRASAQGNPSAQSRLGLLYDKGHGVPQNVILAYKWLNLAAAHAVKREREYYLRLRNAVASKMSAAQISEGQHLALIWTQGGW
jgi:uncharacterized protein